MARTSQGGSVLSFVIIGVVLAGMLVGGVYLVNRQTPTVSPPQQPVPQREEPQKPAEEKTSPPSAEPGSTQPRTPSAVPETGVTSELPATGMKETAGTVIIIGLLSATTVAYLRSRRPQLSFDL